MASHERYLTEAFNMLALAPCVGQLTRPQMLSASPLSTVLSEAAWGGGHRPKIVTRGYAKLYAKVPAPSATQYRGSTTGVCCSALPTTSDMEKKMHGPPQSRSVLAAPMRIAA
jgi:hypothetical protein